VDVACEHTDIICVLDIEFHHEFSHERNEKFFGNKIQINSKIALLRLIRDSDVSDGVSSWIFNDAFSIETKSSDGKMNDEL
jgi:succinylarginine dihydrolase